MRIQAYCLEGQFLPPFPLFDCFGFCVCMCACACVRERERQFPCLKMAVIRIPTMADLGKDCHEDTVCVLPLKMTFFSKFLLHPQRKKRGRQISAGCGQAAPPWVNWTRGQACYMCGTCCWTVWPLPFPLALAPSSRRPSPRSSSC